MEDNTETTEANGGDKLRALIQTKLRLNKHNAELQTKLDKIYKDKNIVKTTL